MLISIVGIYTFLHFCVDFACAFLLYHQIHPLLNNIHDIFYAFLLYNFFAFAVQLPIGTIADYVNKNPHFSMIGCMLVLLAYICVPLGITACVIAGIGNAFFHIGAGVDILHLAKKKATIPGIFVSSGALGIFLGVQQFFKGIYMPYFFIGLMIIGCFLSSLIYYKFHEQLGYKKNNPFTLSKLKILMIFCLCLTVLLRSYTGFVLAFSWKNIFIIGLVFTIGIVMGKMLGGILSDKFGIKKVAFISLSLSALSFYFAFQDNYIGISMGIIGVLLFNMTMPITLSALTNLIPNQKGMAFGLLTFMLFLGATPFLFGHKYPFFTPIGLTSLVLISLVILYIGLFKIEKA